MGLASKLAAANSARPAAGVSPYPPASASTGYGAPATAPSAYGAAPAAAPQYGQQAPAYGQQQGQYGQAAAQQTPQGQYGQPPPQPPRWQYGYAAPPASGAPPVPGSRPGATGQQGAYGQPAQQGAYGAPPGPPGAYGQQGQGQQGAYGAPQGQQGAYGAQQGAYGAPQGSPAGYGQQGRQGQQGAYGAPQGAPGAYGTPQGAPSAYGAPQGAPGAYGAPQGAPQGASAGGVGSVGYDAILQILITCVNEQKISAFYPPGSLEAIAQRIVSTGAITRIAAEWNVPLEIAIDLARLALFDTILYLDDSGSMSFEEGGSRIDDLKLIVQRVSYAASLLDDDGIQVRFMNSNVDGNNIKSDQQVQQLISQVRFSGLTPLGTSLDKKILGPLVIGPAQSNRLQKPVLVIAVTDGAPGGENRNTLVKVITQAKRALASTRYGADAISFQLAQVGNDLKARQFLEEIDNNPEIGGLVDTTSNYENEADNMAKANPPVDLTPELWLVKLILGGIDDSYDAKDE